MKEFNTLDDFSFQDKTVLLRVDINCPLVRDTFEIEDDNRILQMVPTLKELLNKCAKVVILAHQGRPGDWDFIPLDKHAKVLTVVLGEEVRYIDDIVGETAVSAIRSLQPCDAIMLKNVRELPYEQEEKEMEEHAQSELVKVLAPLADYYVCDAFASAHRAHCSLVGFQAVLPSVAGRLMEKELGALKNVFESPQKPSVFVLGGAKFGDSVKVVNRVLSQKIVDMVVLVGLTSGAFLVARGVKPGKPNEVMLAKEVTPETLVEAKKLLEEKGDNILLPYDVAIEMEGERKDIPVGELPVNYPILDIGKGSISKFTKVLAGAKTVFMSGPAGMIEKKSFALGTKELMTAMTNSKAYSVIGGGHTVGAAEAFGLVNSFSYVSTGGGALETYLLGEPLPAVEALKLAFKRLDCSNSPKTGHQDPPLNTVPTED